MTNRQPGSPTHLRVRVEIDGGFAPVPGLNRPFELDSDRLEPALASALDTKLTDLRFFDRPTQQPAAAPGAADHRTYTITATRGTRSHTVRLAEPIADAAMRELVEQLLSWHRHLA